MANGFNLVEATMLIHWVSGRNWFIQWIHTDKLNEFNSFSNKQQVKAQTKDKTGFYALKSVSVKSCCNMINLQISVFAWHELWFSLHLAQNEWSLTFQCSFLFSEKINMKHIFSVAQSRWYWTKCWMHFVF